MSVWTFLGICPCGLFLGICRCGLFLGICRCSRKQKARTTWVKKCQKMKFCWNENFMSLFARPVFLYIFLCGLRLNNYISRYALKYYFILSFLWSCMAPQDGLSILQVCFFIFSIFFRFLQRIFSIFLTFFGTFSRKKQKLLPECNRKF